MVHVPGWSNIWTQPIINRINMLATGVRTDIGVKVFGDDLDEIQEVSQEVAEVLAQVPGAVGIVPDQSTGKGYLEIRPKRERATHYGVNVSDIWDVVEGALAGHMITTTVEGRERFPIRVRYARGFREDEEDVKNLLIKVSSALDEASVCSKASSSLLKSCGATKTRALVFRATARVICTSACRSRCPRI